MPVSSTENLRQIVLQNQVSTGMELTDDERFRVLDTQTWNERRNRLEGDY